MSEPASYESDLGVYVVWHPEIKGKEDVSEGSELAGAIYSRFARDVKEPLARGLGLPVYFRSTPAAPPAPQPAPIDFTRARRTAVFVLVDAAMMLNPQWTQYVEQLQQSAGGEHRLFPVSLFDGALQFDPAGTNWNYIRHHTFDDARKVPQLLLWLTHELCRFLGEPRPGVAATAGDPPSPLPVKLFISHAKKDGQELAKNLRTRILETPAKEFFDAVDIASGYDFGKEIEDHIGESVLVAVQSDAYSSRPWCRQEVLAAKRLQRPIVIVNALEEEEKRSFPYLGNVPVIRWKGDNYNEIISLALLENLRFLYTNLRVARLREAGRIKPDSGVLLRAPEILDCYDLIRQPEDAAATAREPRFVVYPDPPLGAEETKALSQFCPGVSFTTLTMPGEDVLLTKKVIGLSISNSPDLAARGFGPMQLRDAMIELARHLLARNAHIAYGGHLETGGFTQVLFELVRSHNALGCDPFEAISDYLAWPLYLDVDPKVEAALRQVATIERVPPPEDLRADFNLDPAVALKPDSPLNRYMFARCLTAMRERLNEDVGVRLVMGGKLKGFQGKYPGIAEEAYLAMKSGKPLFLLGAFGGAARAVAEALAGQRPETLTKAFQMSDDNYAGMAEEYNRQAAAKPHLNLEPVDYESLDEFFGEKGIAGLNNGLSDAENRSLFELIDLDEIVSLVLKGLGNLPA